MTNLEIQSQIYKIFHKYFHFPSTPAIVTPDASAYMHILQLQLSEQHTHQNVVSDMRGRLIER